MSAIHGCPRVEYDEPVERCPPASIIEFLLWLLIAASVIALVAKHLKVPYTVALVMGGFAIDLFRLPIIRGSRTGSGDPTSDAGYHPDSVPASASV